MNVHAEGWVLAGGQSRRMGRDKAFVELNGTPMLHRVLGKLTALGLRARIAGLRDASHDRTGVRAEVVADAHPGCGPLSGIETALRHSQAKLVLVISVDLPLVPVAFLDWMLQRASVSGAVTTVPRRQGQPQPLCAIYRRELLPAVSQSLIEGDFKVMRAIERGAVELGARIDQFDVECLAAAEAWPADLPSHWQLLNCNTPGELALAGMLLARAPML